MKLAVLPRLTDCFASKQHLPFPLSSSEVHFPLRRPILNTIIWGWLTSTPKSAFQMCLIDAWDDIFDISPQLCRFCQISLQDKSLFFTTSISSRQLTSGNKEGRSSNSATKHEEIFKNVMTNFIFPLFPNSHETPVTPFSHSLLDAEEHIATEGQL